MEENTMYETENTAGAVTEAFRRAAEGYRLACITVTPGADAERKPYDMIYTYEKDGSVRHVKLNVSGEDELESVSGAYAYAYLYENEANEMYGLKIAHINLDFKGTLYKKSEREPFAVKG